MGQSLFFWGFIFSFWVFVLFCLFVRFLSGLFSCPIFWGKQSFHMGVLNVDEGYMGWGVRGRRGQRRLRMNSTNHVVQHVSFCEQLDIYSPLYLTLPSSVGINL